MKSDPSERFRTCRETALFQTTAPSRISWGTSGTLLTLFELPRLHFQNEDGSNAHLLNVLCKLMR